jgi:cob(I)alamin adenosyltransferase
MPDPAGRRPSARHGLVIVYTGDGKGKTTAALGLLMRAAGRRMRVCMIQFVKSERGKWGETRAAQQLEIEWHQMGDGFTWTSKDLEETSAKAQQAWEFAQDKIQNGGYDLIVLDEFTYPLALGWLVTEAVIDWLKLHRPEKLHLVITGRGAPTELIEYADLVTEMKAVKHPFEKGVKAQAGIEF